jgi:hypothetical protein
MVFESARPPDDPATIKHRQKEAQAAADRRAAADGSMGDADAGDPEVPATGGSDIITDEPSNE